MQAVLYVGHGSRVKEAAEEAASFIKQTMEEIDGFIQEYCFLELSPPTIMQGVKRCVERGATRIAVIPVLLLAAGHAKTDIPKDLEKVRQSYPSVTFTYGRPLGVHPMMVDVIVHKIREKKPLTGDMNILLVGRGSSDPDTLKDVQVITQLIKSRLDVQSVDYCFLAAAQPRFHQKIADTALAGKKNVIILPYLLFTGILMKEVKSAVAQLPLQKDQNFVICDYLNGHPHLNQLLKERVLEAVQEKVSF
ncbi:sirohydrochlorin chelatase [Halobacillus sp. B23F22_1]|uniref:sirohydrochlorin chelatase n=1 Tax=Halobacillus sp. B23F22_1 TaxID=3459514 RepID=UPI00373EFF00